MAVRNAFNSGTGTLDDPLGLNADGAGSTFGMPPPAAPVRSPYQSNTQVGAGGTPTIPPSAFAMDPSLLNGGGEDSSVSSGSGQVTIRRIGQPPPTPGPPGNPNGGGPPPAYVPPAPAPPAAPGPLNPHYDPNAYSSPLQATAPPGSYASPALDPSIPALVSKYISDNHLIANQSDPTALTSIVTMLRSQGHNAQVDYADANGHSGGILIDGHPYQLIDGSNNWTPLQAWSQGSPSSTASAFNPNASAAFNPNASAAFDPNAAATNQSLMDLIQSGSTPFGGNVQKSLLDILSKGGVAPGTDQQLIAAREAEANAETAQMNDARAQLANQGTVSEPGVTQGPNEEAVAQVQRMVAPAYSGAVSNIEQNQAQLKQQSLITALSIATGMSEAQANTMISAMGTGTQRTAALANISLQLLSQNIDWNKFLATNGLNQAQLEAQIQNNNMQNVIALLHEYILGGGTLGAGVASTTG